MAVPQNTLQEKILQTLARQDGVLFARRAIVHRGSYNGRNILGKNSSFKPECVDDRGYVPVEWWVMSNTMAKNTVPKENEGITKLLIDKDEILLTDALTVAEQQLFGCYGDKWPLVKVLDIGGDLVETSFGTKEVPPIPCHVHAGEFKDGRCCMEDGKLEAYFMLPVDCPPYNINLEKVITRLGLKPQCSKEDLVKAMKQFGFDDSCYTLLKSYQVQSYDCWTIKPGMVHSPGPWPTLEVQRPQDDANHLAWVLGYVEPEQSKRSTKKSQEQLRGVPDEQALLDHMIDFDGSRDPEFESRWRHECLEISSGKWGRHFQIFFGEFYGEGMEINPMSHWAREKDERPYMAIVWSGSGKIQGKLVNAEIDGTQEMLVTPGTKVTIENTDAVNKLLVYAVFPIRKGATNSPH